MKRNGRSAPLQSIFQRSLFQQALQHWLEQRSPAAPEMTLRHRNIYVLPSKFGWGYLLMLLVLFMVGTNYQNNLILGLVFLLVSLFVTSILVGYRNMVGLSLRAGGTILGYAGRHTAVAIRATHPDVCYGLEAYFPGQPPQPCTPIQEAGQRLRLLVTPVRRGWFYPGRLVIQSYYPLGLIRIWSVPDLAISILASPQPAPCSLQLSVREANDTALGTRSKIAGLDEFVGLKAYQQGESRHRIAWKQLAQQRGWHSKQFAGEQSQAQWLTLDGEPGSIEQKLARLAWQAVQLSQRAQPFGLDLGRVNVPVGCGPQHLQQCRCVLALYADPAEKEALTIADSLSEVS